MNPNIKKLEQLVKVLDSYGAVTKEEQLGFMQDVINVLAQFKSATSQINQETKDTLNLIVKQVNQEHTRILEEVSQETTKGVKVLQKEYSSKIEELNKAINTLNSIEIKNGTDGKDGVDGKDADEEKIIEEVLKKVQIPEVDLEPLKEDIDNKFSKVYEHIKKSINGFPGVRLLSNLMDVVLSSPTNGQGIVYDSTLGKWKNGDISASANITVKDEGSTLTSSLASLNFVGSGVTATNVGNDVTVTISTGSATPAGSDTQVQFNDGGSFGADAHFYYNKTTDVLHVHGLAGDATDGLLIESESGVDVGILGAANTANATWYGQHNFSKDIEVTDNTYGLVLKSANGTRWRIGITNAGELTATSL